MGLKLVLQLICLLCLTNASAAAAAAASLAKPGCQDTCGNIRIPYPFGIGENCYINKSFEVICNLSFYPPKPFLSSFNLEVLEVSVLESQLTVGSPNVPSCNDSVDLITHHSIDLGGSPFFISEGWSESPPISSSIPTVLNWGFGSYQGICDYVSIRKEGIYTCVCGEGYRGNPYLGGGCEDINECADPKLNRCVNSRCVNERGGYSCACESGFKKYQSNPYYCDLDESRSFLAPGLGLGVGLLFLLLSLWSYQVWKKQRNKKIKEKFIKRNGGLLLQQQVSSEVVVKDQKFLP